MNFFLDKVTNEEDGVFDKGHECVGAVDLGLVVEESVAAVACRERIVEGNSSVRRTLVQDLEV